MEEFVKSIENIDLSSGLPDELHTELVQKFQGCLNAKDWDSVEAMVVASRQVEWRDALSDQQILGIFAKKYLWTDASPVEARPAILAIRLAANCCLESDEVQANLAQHIDRIQQLLAVPGICEVTVGMLANMLFDEASILEFSTILENGFHETITKQLAADNFAPSHPMFETAIEILDSLAEEDVEAKIPNVSATAAAVANVIDFLLKEPQTPSDRSNDHQLVDMLLRWMTSKDVRVEISKPAYQSSFSKLPQVYESTTSRSIADLEEDPESQRALSKFESILGEFASQAAASETPDTKSGSLFASAMKWIQSSIVGPAPDKLGATGYLVLCNLCNDEFAVTAAHEHKLHKTALATLLRTDSSSEIHVNAAALLANLSQPAANKELILETNIVQDLYDNKDIGVVVKLVRRLLSNAGGDLATTLTGESQGRLPLLKDIISNIPDQKALQDALRSTESNESGQGSQTPSFEQQLTRDIAHIYVAVRRHSPSANKYIAPSLVWALINLVLIGLRTNNAVDVSDGVFGLGLALQDRENPMHGLSLEAIEALRRGDGMVALKQVIEMGRGEQTSPVAKKVAENATSVVHVLVGEAEKNDLSKEAVEELRNVLKLGVDMKLEG